MTLKSEFTNTMDDGISNKKWDEYDKLLQTETNEYNTRFAGTPHFIRLDWKMFKAMVWIEGGGPTNPAWTTRPIQIGNATDQGLGALNPQGPEAADLIMSDQLKRDIKGNINKPDLNIRAGIAYALVRLVKSEWQSVDDPKDNSQREYTVVPGDSLDRISGKVGTTVASLQKLNPTAKVLHPGMKPLKYQKARIQRVITGWMPLTSANLAARYNHKDPAYEEKLNYVLSLFPTLKR